MVNNIDIWRLCEVLSIKEAALLVINEDPSSHPGITELHESQWPVGYEAAIRALKGALKRGDIKGEAITEIGFPLEDEYGVAMPGTIDIVDSMVEVESLREYLSARDYPSSFFFPNRSSTHDFLDKDHPRYAPKLAAAVRAWQAVTTLDGKSAKHALAKWLREHAADLGLSDDDGNPNQTGIDEIAKVANWQLSGGAPKTPAYGRDA